MQPQYKNKQSKDAIFGFLYKRQESPKGIQFVRYKIRRFYRTAKMPMMVIWVVTRCGLAGRHQDFEGTYSGKAKQSHSTMEAQGVEDV
jgi:hypothetical protein